MRYFAQSDNEAWHEKTVFVSNVLECNCKINVIRIKENSDNVSIEFIQLGDAQIYDSYNA